MRPILYTHARLMFGTLAVLSLWPSAALAADISLPKPPDGFDITLFAAPPEVNYPACIAAAPTGELFVGVDKQGSLGRKPGEGKIVRCVDTDGDGKADKITTFANADHPRGLCYDHGSLWVLHPPTLSVFYDDNGDGVSDRSEVLVTGISTDSVRTRGADHTTNGIRMGIDGWLYIAVGDFGFVDATGKDGRQVTLRGGGVARVRPDGTELEVYAYGLRNIVDVAVDPQLNLFVRDNTNDGGGWDTRLMHVIQSAHFGYPMLFLNFDDEVLRPLAEYGGGSGCGALFVSEPLFPKPNGAGLLTCDWGRDRVYFHPLARDGATFAAKQEFWLAIPRPTDIDVDGLGRMYVSSWQNGQFSYAGENIGYVAQLRPKQGTAQPLPDLVKLDDIALVGEIESASHVRRLRAQREILRRGPRPDMAQALLRVTRGSGSLDSRIAAVFTYKQLLGTKATPELVALTKDDALREYVLRALADRTTQFDGVPAAPFLAGLRDADPRVQVAALVGLARLGNRDAAKEILPLTTYKRPVAKDATKQLADPARAVPHVALRTLISLQAADACLAALDGPDRDGALRALGWMHEPVVVDGLTVRLQQCKEATLRRELLNTLARLYFREETYNGSWWGTRPDTKGPYYTRARWERTPKIEEVLRHELATADAATADGLQKQLARYRIKIDGVPAAVVKNRSGPAAQTATVSIPQIDPKNPHLIANLPFEKALEGAATTQGDVKRGAELFTRQGCIACHATESGQAPIGPQLVDIGKRYNRKQLIESIVKPSASIAQGFATNVLLLDSGKTQMGFVVREAADELEIRTSEGKPLVVPKSAIEERSESKISSMPEGLVGNLTVEELASLVAYLESLKSQ